jgi:hypothetical protein
MRRPLRDSLRARVVEVRCAVGGGAGPGAGTEVVANGVAADIVAFAVGVAVALDVAVAGRRSAVAVVAGTHPDDPAR